MDNFHKLTHFSLVICRHPITGMYLAVDESKDRGWWVPGGGVDNGESFDDGAKRECIEEAGVDIILKGIINITCTSLKMRVIYYAEPADIYNCTPK